jgi:hypothetical protein
VTLETEGGIFLGTAPALRLDKERFYRVSERIVRGLFFYEKGHAVPADYLVLNYPQQFGLAGAARVLGDVGFPTPRTVGAGVFSYTYRCAEEDADSCVWISFFYRRLPFIGFTRRPKPSAAEEAVVAL